METMDLAKQYFSSMRDKNIEQLKQLANSDVRVKSPLGELIGLDAFVKFQNGFFKMINSLTLNHVFVDGTTAAIFYTANTKPVAKSDMVELLQFKNNQLISTTVIYDGTPFAEYVKSIQQS
ncbi:nuclear transport factor 2 family protein [Nicoliella lavandulae]|uniref:Nuclear transport factor 2 family protein n=1 Tax=Nicoliella lavandulae TaxID=3082954 RepID=A0ABU8SM06_9LACO